MTSVRDARGDVRERDERDARFFAWDVPGDAQIVALVHEAKEAERSATVVDAIATSVARRRDHTLLLNTETGPSPLDELLGASHSEGLAAALGGRARLTDVAVQRVDRPFVYLPAGKDLVAAQSLLQDEVLASFVGRVRERGGTLFLVLSEGTVLSEGLRLLVDGYVALGDVGAPEGADNLTVFGRVRFGERGGHDDAAGADSRSAAATSPEGLGSELGAAVGEEEAPAPPEPGHDSDIELEIEGAPGAEILGSDPGTGAWARQRAPGHIPAARMGAGAVVILGLLGGWWWFARSADADGAASAPTTVALAEAATESIEPALDPEQVGRLLEMAPELPFSVLVASYADKPDADGRLAELARVGGSEDAVYFIAPTPVRGIVYHRVFAGALPDQGAAEALMERLVAAGAKDESSAWHLRPARLAFDLGVFRDPAKAEARVSDLAARGVPSYVLTTALDGQWVSHVFGGAYENERASLPMAELLDGAGEPATLIARHGGNRVSSSP